MEPRQGCLPKLIYACIAKVTLQCCRLRIYDLPTDVLDATTLHASTPLEDTFLPALRIYGGELIYDYAWYPGMLAMQPETCVFASTTRVRMLSLDQTPKESQLHWQALCGRDDTTSQAKCRGMNAPKECLTQ